jgi:hypothetical protein
MNVVLIFFLSTAALFPLSMLPKNFAQENWWTLLSGRMIAVSISVALLLIAYKLGAFKERHLQKFKRDLNELVTLRSMLTELRGN